MEITVKDIMDLYDESRRRRDIAMVRECELAMIGDEDALAIVVRVLAFAAEVES